MTGEETVGEGVEGSALDEPEFDFGNWFAEAGVELECGLEMKEPELGLEDGLEEEEVSEEAGVELECGLEMKEPELGFRDWPNREGEKGWEELEEGSVLDVYEPLLGLRDEPTDAGEGEEDWTGEEEGSGLEILEPELGFTGALAEEVVVWDGLADGDECEIGCWTEVEEGNVLEILEPVLGFPGALAEGEDEELNGSVRVMKEPDEEEEDEEPEEEEELGIRDGLAEAGGWTDVVEGSALEIKEPVLGFTDELADEDEEEPLLFRAGLADASEGEEGDWTEVGEGSALEIKEPVGFTDELADAGEGEEGDWTEVGGGSALEIKEPVLGFTDELADVGEGEEGDWTEVGEGGALETMEPVLGFTGELAEGGEEELKGCVREMKEPEEGLRDGLEDVLVETEPKRLVLVFVLEEELAAVDMFWEAGEVERVRNVPEPDCRDTGALDLSVEGYWDDGPRLLSAREGERDPIELAVEVPAARGWDEEEGNCGVEDVRLIKVPDWERKEAGGVVRLIIKDPDFTCVGGEENEEVETTEGEVRAIEESELGLGPVFVEEEGERG